MCEKDAVLEGIRAAKMRSGRLAPNVGAAVVHNARRCEAVGSPQRKCAKMVTRR